MNDDQYDWQGYLDALARHDAAQVDLPREHDAWLDEWLADLARWHSEPAAALEYPDAAE